NFPPLPVRLELSSALIQLPDKGGLVEAVSEATARELSRLLNALGIPGRPRIGITTLNGAGSETERLLRVSVHDRCARFPAELLEQVRSYLAGTLPLPEAKTADVVTRLNESRRTCGDAVLLEFLSHACREIIKLQPTIALNEAQAEAYAASLPKPAEPGPARGWPPDAQSMLYVMGQTLRLRISLADRRTVARIVQEGWAAGRALTHIAEDLIAELSSDVVELRMRADDLRRFTVEWAEDGAAQFQFLREGLFQERGLSLPAFRFAVDDDLKPNSFCVKINDAALMPARLIDAKQCLVNDTAERIPRSEDGNEGPTPVTNPASGQPGSLVPLSRKERLEAAGLTTWNQIQFVVLSLAADLRRFGFCLVNRSVVRRHLDRCELAYPALVKAARNQISDERIT